ncbi:hypothetical protein SAMN04488116_1113 [Flagellimonas flava]|uniref:Uncharacterized protein n=1 Tax=Flagellimonas flava TaxID=570519 RepID=A0A1M5J5L4_9FLAO|nr:hypothetical protein SAMN04488116_1113 [Allomuricauda flava]
MTLFFYTYTCKIKQKNAEYSTYQAWVIQGLWILDITIIEKLNPYWNPTSTRV